jgi:hypothetical protein
MPTNASQPDTTDIPEIRLVRRLIRKTHRDVRHGYINYLAGMRLIARLTESLAKLLQTNHRLSSTQSSRTIPRLKPYLDIDDPRFDPDLHEPFPPLDPNPNSDPNSSSDPPYSQSDYAKLHPW